MSQVNHNYQYIKDVDGLTVWERLRVIRNFLTDRRKALKLATLNKEKYLSQLEEMDKWDRLEAEIMNVDQDELIQDCIDEIKFLEDFESKLAKRAELERIEGKTDREMYEINFAKESRYRLVHKAKAEMLAVGHISPQLMETFMKDSKALEMAVEEKILAPTALTAISSKSTMLLLEDIGVSYADYI